jgi:iron complex outermembrane receptor protein
MGAFARIIWGYRYMMNRKRVFWATSALFTGMIVAGAASAQSTGTTAAEATSVEEVVVTGTRGPRAIGPAVAQNVDKARSTITQETIARQQPGQTILQTLNLVPGLNFTNSDPYGNSGGNIRLRGFDGNRVGLAVDGVPLNDTGNYATYTNQQIDPELIERASVNQGSTDNDSPTAAALGGIINYTTVRPYDEPGMTVTASKGTFSYGRVFGRVDSGAFGPWGTTAFLAASYTDYQKFKGPGELEKIQYNGRVYQELGDKGDFTALAFNWNENRNHSYNNFNTLATFNAGLRPENDKACFAPLGVDGTVQNETTQSTAITYFGGVLNNTSCTNASELRNNPSNTGSLRGNFSYHLRDNLRLTIDPSFQYTMANGGGFTVVSERDDRLDQNGTNNAALTTAAQCLAVAVNRTGVDLNGDGDSCDSVTLYTPSNTNTRRYGVLSSLIWDITDAQRLRFSFSNDYGRHRQTGEATRTIGGGLPINVFGGENTWGDENARIIGRDGSYLRTRDRFSEAILNQFSLDYRGLFLNDALTVMVGVRAPYFTRNLNQYCYSQNGSTTALCTTQAVATTLPNGNVQFAGNTNQYIAPYQKTFKYDDILPNVTLGYDFGSSNIFASYSEQIAVPRTDNLYIASRSATATTVQPLAFNGVQPETSTNSELGYRFTNSAIVASISGYFNTYENRVVSSLDNDPTSPTFGLTVDRNVGKVETKGVEGSIGWRVFDSLSLYGSVTYTDSELQEDQVALAFTCPTVAPTGTAPGAGCTPGTTQYWMLPTKGKSVVETPEWQTTFRGDWQATEELSLGLQAKWVDDRFTTDVNDEKTPGYTVVDFDARYDLTNTFGIKDAYVQFNVTNLFDSFHAGNISSGSNATTIADIDPGPGIRPFTGSARTFSLGAPRTLVLTVGTRF